MGSLPEKWIFFKRWCKNPKQLGTFAPISKGFSNKIANYVKPYAKKHIIELGAGTGRLTQALIENNIKNLIPVEIDQKLSIFLENRFYNNKNIHKIITGDASEIDKILPDLQKKVPLVISVLPFMCFSLSLRQKILNSIFKMLTPSGKCFHVCYTPFSPIKKCIGYYAEKKIIKLLHLPTGFVWEIKKK